MSKKTLGVTSEGWGALKKFAVGMVLGNPIEAAQDLMNTPAASETSAAPPQEELHEPGSPSCGKKDGGFHCIAHNDEGQCVMVRDR